MGLGQLLYISDAFAGITPDQIEAIRATSACNNALRGITGILFFSAGHFIQLLEGDPNEIRTLFETIVSDDRHHHVKLLFERPAENRLFDDWDMALLDLDACTPAERMDLDDLVHLAGYQAWDEDGLPVDLAILKRFRSLLTAA